MSRWICERACVWDPTWEKPSRCPHCCGFTTPDRAEALRHLREARP